MKIYFIVLDGAGDRSIISLNNMSPLEYASTPNMDKLAKHAKSSMIDIISSGIVPESDTGSMALLGYDPEEYYCGRGALEAYGLGYVKNYKYSASFRINFASYNDEKEILDRRTARGLSDSELKKLANDLERKIILPVDISITAFAQYRGILSFMSNEIQLSGDVCNTDPGFVKCGNFVKPVKNYLPKPVKCEAISNSAEAKYTAELVNYFSVEATKLLSSHPINISRRKVGLPMANCILFRDGGNEVRTLPSFFSRTGYSLCLYGQLAAEKALAEIMNADFKYVQLLDYQLNSSYLTDLAIEMRNDGYDISYIHLKGPDEPGHDGKPFEKVKAIEIIDNSFFRELYDHLAEDDIVVVTCDHATPCEKGIHTADKVPLVIYSAGFDRNEGGRFTERSASSAPKIISSALDIIPYILTIVRR